MSADSATNGVAGAASATSASPNGGASAAQPAASSASATPWYGDVSADPDLKGWVETKNFKTPADALKSYRDAEKLLGVPKERLLKLPDKQFAKPEEYDPAYKALGWPEKPEYQLPQGMEKTDFASAVMPLLHQAKLTQSQFETLAPLWNTFIENQVAAGDAEKQKADEAAAAQEQIDIESLKREWPGNIFEERKQMAQTAVRQFLAPFVKDSEELAGLLNKLDDAWGPSKVMKLFSNIGEKVGEGKFTGDPNAQRREFGMTPAQAKARKDELMADKTWAAKALNPKSAEAAELDRLQRLERAGMA